jgi:hypothetical protein
MSEPYGASPEYLAARAIAHAAGEALLRASQWYEVHAGIRPPRRSGKVRGVLAEHVEGGGLELWHCGHDHAPGVRRIPDLTPEQEAAAVACAIEHAEQEKLAGRLSDWPVRRA